MSFLKYAAVWAGILLVSAFAIWQFKKTGNTAQTVLVYKENKQGFPVKYVLPDSSEVYLGTDSKIRYPAAFADDKREIVLEGEAFFDVKHRDKQPFIIHTGNVQTQVLGTSFKVKAFQKQQIMVAVATGKVGVSAMKDGALQTMALLTPGLKITYDNKTGKSVTDKTDVNSLNQWKSGDLVFDEELLSNAAQELQRRYKIQIYFKDKDVAAHHVGGVFVAGEPVENILNMLGEVGHFEYQTNDHKTFNISIKQ